MSRTGASIGEGWPLLERDRETDALAEVIDRATAGTGGAVVIEGAAGVGKTELLERARVLGQGRGTAVLTGQGAELERHIPYGLTRQLFEPVVRSSSVEELDDLLGEVAGVVRNVVRDVRQPEVRDPRQGIFYGFYWLLSRLAEQAPQVLLVDDLQWADPVSIELLEFLARRVHEMPAAIVAAARPIGSPGAFPGAELMRLQTLSPAACGSLVRAALGESLGADVVDACHATTGGNPFLLRELMREFVAEGLREPLPDQIRGLSPAAVSRSVLMRINRLSAPAHQVARAVAVLGRHAELRHVARLAGVELDAAGSAAADLIRAEILADARPLQFLHPMLRSVVEEDMSEPARALAHREAAALLTEAGQTPEQVAPHLLVAEPVGDVAAVDVLERAAASATARGATAIAARYLRRALDEPPPAERRFDLLRQAGSAAMRALDADSVEHLEGALALADTPAARGAVLADLAMAHLTRGEAEIALERLTASTPAIAEQDREAGLRLEAQLSGIARLVGGDASRAFGSRALRFASLAGDTPAERLLLANVSQAVATSGVSAPEAAGLAERALGGGALIEDEGPEEPAVYLAIFVLIVADRFDTADRLLDRAVSDARARGSMLGLAIASTMRAQSAYRRGDVPRAEAEARIAIAPSRLMGSNLGLPNAHAHLVDALMERGALEEATAELESCGLLDAEMPEGWLFLGTLGSRARVRLALNRRDEAVADIAELARREAAGDDRPPGTSYRSWAAPVLAHADRRDEAIAMAEDELAWSRGWGAPRAVGLALRAAAHAYGGADMIALLEEAVETLRASPAELEFARVSVDLGAALRRGGKPREAREHLHRGLDVARRCGATALVARADDELGASGLRRRNRALLSGVEALTPSERRVALLAAEGASNPEIAQTLFVTRKTVEMHLGNAYRKLDINSRDDLAAALAK
jgi:DNA-binding CsgD family transcriptional regulator